MPRLVLSPTLPLHVPTSSRSFRRRQTFIASAVLLFFVTVLFVYSSKTSDIWRKPLVPSSHTYVLSLARRTDRRKSMESLRKTLGLDWEYVNATEIESERVNGAYRRVQALRDGATARNLSPAGKTPPFSWPSDINKRAATREDLHLRETAFWRMPAAYRETEGPLRAAERDFHLKAYEAGIAEAKLLTTARVACWDTHLGVIKKIAHSELDVGIVLEDDVDMERDIKERLAGVWEALPSTWDMVFFGHCWSNETYYPAVGPNLYPSRSPKCTHGYALSRTGARKLFMHLVYPPFAYSRAIDQAYAWLIKSKRIESYSISPSIIVQRKVGVSDVMKGKGSRWRDTLVDGVFRT